MGLTGVAGGDVGFDRLRKRERYLGALFGRAKQYLVVGVADVARLEEH